jgi:hypothetical protein
MTAYKRKINISLHTNFLYTNFQKKINKIYEVFQKKIDKNFLLGIQKIKYFSNLKSYELLVKNK